MSIRAFRKCSPLFSTSRRTAFQCPSPSRFATRPWFMDDLPENVPHPHEQGQAGPSYTRLSTESTTNGGSQNRIVRPDVALKPLSPDVPEILRLLYAQLSALPHLERSNLEIRRHIESSPGPPLPHTLPKGRRKRGRTDYGLGVPDTSMGLWKWAVLAQVKLGTEGRGSIESVARVVRKTFLSAQPPLPLPPKRRRSDEDGWTMIDAGDYVVHILSQSAREKFFPDGSLRAWEW